MADDQPPSSGDPNGGGGAEQGLGEGEDLTRVEISRAFLVGQLDRQSKAHERLRGIYAKARDRVAAGAGSLELLEAREQTEDLIEIAEGTVRAIDRTLISEDEAKPVP